MHEVTEYHFDPDAPLNEPRVRTVIKALRECGYKAFIDRHIAYIDKDAVPRAIRQVKTHLSRYVEKFMKIDVRERPDVCKEVEARIYLPYVLTDELKTARADANHYLACYNVASSKIDAFNALPWHKRVWKIVKNAKL